MTTLYRLVYHSLNRLAGDEAEIGRAVEQILATSRSNNETVGVTGALMFNSGFFAQVLEGPEAAIEATFERIQGDDRHGDVTALEFTPVDHRAFSNWSMAYVGAKADRFSDIARSSGFDPAALSGEQLFMRLRDLLLAEGTRAA